MFFDELELGQLKKRAALRVPPPIPHTGWTPPREFPRLDGAVALSFDTETKDVNLLEKGPGWVRRDGHICGFSVAAVDSLGNRGKWYFPVRHEVESHDNLDPTNAFNWLRDNLQTPHVPKIGANLLYDIGWLTTENIFVQGELHDVQFAEALLNESGEVNLEYLGQKYVGSGKETSLMYTWSAQAYGGEIGSKQRANIYRCPPRLVGFYGESDADLPLSVLERQTPLMRHERLYDLYRMECDLIYLLTRMRMRGVRVDVQAAERMYVELGAKVKNLYAELKHNTGVSVDSVNSGGQLAKLFDACGVSYPRTAEGAPSFQKKWLEALDHPLGDAINNIREHEKLRSTFVKSYILEGNVKGRVHTLFHPLRGDENGTRSGRLASSDPNLQNIPSRTELGKLVREIFVPDCGHCWWRKFDYSQIEYRNLVHFAVGPGSDDVRKQYCDDPDTDYHVFTQQLVKMKTGRDIPRKPIKNINFGLLYGMGKPKLARQLGVGRDEAEAIFKAYHSGAPYVKATMDAASAEAADLGYITTILGRRSRFDLWEPAEINYENRAFALPFEAALRQYGPNIKRAHTHKAINRRLQGSSADQMKLAMWRGWKDGVFDVIGVPGLTVHDELDFSDDGTCDEAFMYFQHVMETCITMRIPIRADMDIGPNWGACESEDDLRKKAPDDPRIAYYAAYNARRRELAYA